MSWVCLQFVIVVYPDHTHLLFLGHLTGKVNVNAWFTEEEGSASFDRTIVFARMCPSKIMDLQFDPIEISNQKISSWKVVHAMLSFKP